MTQEEINKKYGLLGEQLPDLTHKKPYEPQSKEDRMNEIWGKLPLTFFELRHL